jgi:hypothetical protein
MGNISLYLTVRKERMVMSLRDDIEKFKKDIPGMFLEMVRSEDNRLKQSGITERCLKKGDRAPAFSLPNQHRKTISSDDLLSQGPLVVAFYRGGW